ncbi:MAG: lipopolysaccharide biosynthesis protein [Myxococcaceae bacterium]|nr:lipopolysaccharide biosynthesis protein [Myxococcaceae bacterium]
MTQEKTSQGAGDEAAVAAHIKRGFVWLGAASAVSRVLDACSTLGVLWFVSREELGLATLAWSLAVFLEAFNGLGVSTALVQSPSLSKESLSDAFWYALGTALLFTGAVWAVSPWLAELWGAPAIAPLIRVSSLKLLFVSGALVPLAILNRSMTFERIAAANTLATLVSGVATLSLAALGFGAWALVLGQLMYGVVILLASHILSPFRPQLTFSFARLKPMAAFGIRAAASGVVYSLYRNADYFFLGRYLGVSAVGVYRVGFDLAMTPTMAVLQIVNRAALPGYAKLQHDRAALSRTFSWTIKSLSLMMAPVTVVVAFSARDILSVVDHGRWVDAAEVTAWLAWATLLRSLAHLFPQLFSAVGRPALALLDSLLSALVLCVFFVCALHFLGNTSGILVMGWAWLAASVFLLVVLVRFARLVIPFSASQLLAGVWPGLAGLALLSALALLCNYTLAGASVWLRLSLRSALLIGSYFAYLRWALGIGRSDLLARRS